MDWAQVLMTQVLMSIVTVGASSLVAYLIAKKFGDVAGSQAAIDYEAQKDQEDTSSFRVLLRQEIDQNLAQLRELWHEIPRHTVETIYVGQIANGALRFLASPLPAWNTQTWESQTPRVLAAIGSESQQVRYFYASLNEVTAIHSTLTQLWKEDREHRRAFRGSPLMIRPPPSLFRQRAEELWLRCTAIAKRILSIGNPL